MNNKYINCSIDIDNNDDNIYIKGFVVNPTSYNKMFIIAPNPLYKNSSYSGSALPYPNSDIAFDNTKNIFNINSDGLFEVVFKYPNSFYEVDGKTKIGPSIFFILDKNKLIYNLPELYKLKTLNDRFKYNDQHNPSFYDKDKILCKIDTSENTMYKYSNLKVSNNIA